jgi:hypothetical protein
VTLWSAIVLIVALLVIGHLVRSHQNAKMGYGTDKEGNPVGSPARERELQAEIEQLRERLEVLERIATDDRETRRLAAEIETLREETREEEKGGE